MGRLVPITGFEERRSLERCPFSESMTDVERYMFWTQDTLEWEVVHRAMNCRSATPTPPSETTSHKATLPSGIQIHWFQCGTGPAAFLLHGFPELPQSFCAQIEQLSKDYTVITPHLRGYSPSSCPMRIRDYPIEGITQDIIDLAEHQGSRYHVAGHDGGGTIAWEVAMAAPENVVTVSVLNSCPPRLLLNHFIRSGQIRRSWYMFLFQIPGLAERYFRKAKLADVQRIFMAGAANRSVFERKDLSAYVELLNDPDFGGFKYYRAALRRRLPELRPVRAPAQLIWGLEDPALGSHIADENKYQHWTSSFTVHRIEGAGHWVQQEAPDIVNQHLFHFWQTHD